MMGGSCYKFSRAQQLFMWHNTTRAADFQNPLRLLQTDKTDIRYKNSAESALYVDNELLAPGNLAHDDPTSHLAFH